MTLYARPFLAFLAGLMRADPADAYLFHTRLVRITEALRDDDPLRALNRLTLLADGFGGGSRIGGGAGASPRPTPGGSSNGRTVVMILSDGYDSARARTSGQALARCQTRLPDPLAEPAEGLARLCPVAAGMAAALPHLDLSPAPHAGRSRRPGTGACRAYDHLTARTPVLEDLRRPRRTPSRWPPSCAPSTPPRPSPAPRPSSGRRHHRRRLDRRRLRPRRRRPRRGREDQASRKTPIRLAAPRDPARALRRRRHARQGRRRRARTRARLRRPLHRLRRKRPQGGVAQGQAWREGSGPRRPLAPHRPRRPPYRRGHGRGDRAVDPRPDRAGPPHGSRAVIRLLARLFPPLSPAQADLLARVRFPCC
jgi:hypothetical protein